VGSIPITRSRCFLLFGCENNVGELVTKRDRS